jgi:hypothetical protein
MPPLLVRVLAYSRGMQSHPHAPNLPIFPEAFISRFDALSAELEYRACDHTLEKSMTWLAVHGYDVLAVTQWLKRRGGYCDCEVLLNVEPKVLGAE